MLYHYLSQSHEPCFLLEISGQTLQFSLLSPAVSAKIYEATRLTPLRRRVPSCWADPAMKLHDIFLFFLKKKKVKENNKAKRIHQLSVGCLVFVFNWASCISNLVYTNISWFWIPIVMDWPECPPPLRAMVRSTVDLIASRHSFNTEWFELGSFFLFGWRSHVSYLVSYHIFMLYMYIDMYIDMIDMYI